MRTSRTKQHDADETRVNTTDSATATAAAAVLVVVVVRRMRTAGVRRPPAPAASTPHRHSGLQSVTDAVARCLKQLRRVQRPTNDNRASILSASLPLTVAVHAVLLWPPIVMGRSLYFTPVISIFFLFFFLLFSLPNLSGRRLDVYHTSTHAVALVRI